MIWREKRWLLAGLGALLLLNLGFFLTYRVRYQERVDSLSLRRDEAMQKFQVARNSRLNAQRQLDAHAEIVRTIERIYNQAWATPKERLTPLLLEVHNLAKKSQLIPKTVTYDPAQEKKGLGTTAVEISFSVQGTYQQFRQLVNLIEISKQFLIIDAVRINEANSDGILTVSLKLKTIFRGQPQQAPDSL